MPLKRPVFRTFVHIFCVTVHCRTQGILFIFKSRSSLSLSVRISFCLFVRSNVTQSDIYWGPTLQVLFELLLFSINLLLLMLFVSAVTTATTAAAAAIGAATAALLVATMM